MVALNELLCWDQYYAIGGALRHIEFRPDARHASPARRIPASVSTAPVQAMEISLYPAYNVLSKMISCHPELRATSCASAARASGRRPSSAASTSGASASATSWSTRWWARSARSRFRDGISTGGQARSPDLQAANVEHTEQSFPILILYRRENTDSGGAGKYRGGNSAITAFIPHGTSEIEHETESSGAAIPTAPGLAGGYPACTNAYEFKRDSDILEWFRARRLPGDIAELGGRDELLQLRQTDIHQGPSDVYAVAFAAGAGYGDPIERDPGAGA